MNPVLELLQHPIEAAQMGLMLAAHTLGILPVLYPMPKPDCKPILEMQKSMDTSHVLLDYGDTYVMIPQVFCTGDFLEHIFSVPEPNAVGTNDIDNAISVLVFKDANEETKNAIEKHIVKKNFLDEVTGAFDFRYLPLWSNDEIAYSQSRGFIIANVKKKSVEIQTVCEGISSGDIGNVAVLDARKRIFVFEILRPKGGPKGELWDSKTLRIVHFDKGEMQIVAEHEAGLKKISYSEPWFVHDGTIFIYRDNLTKLEAFDGQFKPINHPLSVAFAANNKGFRCLLESGIHPMLPFGIFIEIGKELDWKKFEQMPSEVFEKVSPPLIEEQGRRSLLLFRWMQSDPKQQMIPIVTKVGSIWGNYKPIDYTAITFSPDGKWFVFQDRSEDDKNPIFVAVPIDETNPIYLGKPIKLGKVMRPEAVGPTGTAWATNPTSFVMCDGVALYKWNLGDIGGMKKVKMPPEAKQPF